MSLQDLCERIVRDAIPATESGATCFVPRYQIDQLREAIAAAPQPPAEAQAQGGGEVVAVIQRPGWPNPDSAVYFTMEHAAYDLPPGTPLYTAPPSAPVGVEAALRIAHRHLDMDSMRVSHCKDAAAIEAALAQQPAACTACNDRREVGGATPEGFETHPCPECAHQPAAVDRRHPYVQSKDHGGCANCGYPEWEPWHALAQPGGEE